MLIQLPIQTKNHAIALYFPETGLPLSIELTSQSDKPCESLAALLLYQQCPAWQAVDSERRVSLRAQATIDTRCLRNPASYLAQGRIGTIDQWVYTQ